MARELSYQGLCLIAELNRQLANGEIDAEHFDGLRAEILAQPDTASKTQPAAASRSGLSQRWVAALARGFAPAIRIYVERQTNQLHQEIVGLEQRVAELERQLAEAKVAPGAPRLRVLL